MEQKNTYMCISKMKHTRFDMVWRPLLPLLTFDPVTLVQVDLALSLDSIGPDHHEVSSRDGAVQLPPGS